MNVLRVLRFAIPFVLLLLAVPAWAASDDNLLVLMEHTAGPAAWTAAERRLVAELRGLTMRVVVEGAATELDEDLPERVVRLGAFVGIQVLRDGDRGIIRFWFPPQRGQRSGYQHVEMNLRNVDVVSRAVLPVVEVIFDRTQTSMSPGEKERDDGVASSDPCHDVGTPMCRGLLALRAGVGGFLVHADSGATTAVNLGLRLRLWSATRLEIDGAYLFRGQPAIDEELHDQKLVRAHLMFEGWGKDGRGAAIGPGLGLVSIGNSRGQAIAPSVGARAAVFAPISRRANLVFTLSGGRAIAPHSELVSELWHADAMLTVDWYLW